MSETTETEPRGLYERLKSQDEGWELWGQLAVGLLALQIGAYAVAFLRIGEPSIIAYSIVIALLGVLTMPLMFWGLLRALFRPPAWRLSRTIAFGCLLLVGLLGNVSFLSAPVSTGDWTSEREFRLPFDGPWTTLAGGDDKTHNYHATTPAYRWGYDFAPLVDGARYEGDGSELEDHHCYGTPVLAPVDAEIVSVLGAERDNAPGDYDANTILGNHIIMKVDADEFLFLAHLKHGSLQVGSGDRVTAGEVVAKCGNSGRTQTPHLHVHMQNDREFPLAESLPLRFHNYLADGEFVELGMPKGGEEYIDGKGQIVEHRPDGG